MRSHGVIGAVLVCALQIQASVIPLQADQSNLLSSPHPIPLDAPIYGNPELNHILHRRGKESDRAASAAAIATQYKAEKAIKAATVREEDEQRKAQEKSARLERAAEEARRLAVELANRPIPTEEEIAVAEKDRQEREKRTATNRLKRAKSRSKKVEADRVAQLAKEESEAKQKIARDQVEAEEKVEQEKRQQSQEKQAKRDRVKGLKQALEEARTEREEFQFTEGEELYDYLHDRTIYEMQAQDARNRITSRLEPARQELQTTINTVLAKYLKSEGGVNDYNPQLTELDLSGPDRLKIGIKYAGTLITSRVLKKVEVHPIYVAALRKCARLRQMIQQELSSLKAASETETRVYSEIASKDQWWAERVNGLEKELDAAVAALE